MCVLRINPAIAEVCFKRGLVVHGVAVINSGGAREEGMGVKNVQRGVAVESSCTANTR